ncbi:hypothetical protein N752_06815 [Desulforamulus aquiferis]|nr:AMP-binding protein [Desulforamulus aquiferis]RYD05951.1 hypothetical protein N752_06815 [Desulforamulus aquiferis]
MAISGLEYSKASRLKDKLKTCWLPDAQIYAGEPFKLAVDPGKSYRNQKMYFSEKIQEVMQETLFASKNQQLNNLFNQLLISARTHGPNKTIVRDAGQTMSYRTLIIASYLISNKLSSKISTENNIGVLLPNAAANVVTLFSLFYQGKTPAILNFSTGIQNILASAETADLKTIITSRQFITKAGLGKLVDLLAHRHIIIYLEDVKGTVTLGDKLIALLQYFRKKKSPARNHKLILFTSGSEGRPKGVVLSHGNIMANINQVSSVVDFTSRDKILNVLPIFHSFGLTVGTLLPIFSGMEVYLHPNPLHYKIVPELSYDFSATILFGTSTFLNGYGKNAHPYDFYSIRYVFAGAEKLKEETRKLWLDKFGIRILEGYGTTETAPVLSINTPIFNKKDTVASSCQVYLGNYKRLKV